jgi:hypothetical protein
MSQKEGRLFPNKGEQLIKVVGRRCALSSFYALAGRNFM